MGYVDCTDCAAGKASEKKIYADIDPMNALQRCETCEAGRYAGQGKSTCTPCAPGEYSETEAPYCIACPAGKMANSESNSLTGR